MKNVSFSVLSFGVWIMEAVLEWPGWLQQLWINVIITLLVRAGRSWERTHGQSLEGTVKTVCWGLKLPSLLTAGSPFRRGTSAGRRPCLLLLLLLLWTPSFSLLSLLCDTELEEAKHDSGDADAIGTAKSCERDWVLFHAPSVMQEFSCPVPILISDIGRILAEKTIIRLYWT